MSGCAKTSRLFDGTGDTSFRPQRISSEKKRELKKFVEVGAKQPRASLVCSPEPKDKSSCMESI